MRFFAAHHFSGIDTIPLQNLQRNPEFEIVNDCTPEGFLIPGYIILEWITPDGAD